jgi:hypothetical protein
VGVLDGTTRLTPKVLGMFQGGIIRTAGGNAKVHELIGIVLCITLGVTVTDTSASHPQLFRVLLVLCHKPMTSQRVINYD